VAGRTVKSDPEPSSDWPREIALVVAAAAPRITAAQRGRVRSLAADRPDWAAVLDIAARQGTIALLHHGLNDCAGDLTPEPIRARLREAYRHQATSNLVLAGELNRIIDVLHRDAVRVLPFKGPTLAALAYGGLSLRSFSDLDLLIAPQDLDRACRSLASAACSPCYSLTRDEQRYHVATKKEWPMWGRHSVLIELHTHPTGDAYRLPLEFDELWSRRRRVTVAGRSHWTLSTEDLCLLLGVHGAKHQWESLG